MRVFLGMILGALLTVSGAYLYDTAASGPPGSVAPAAQQRTMVNWDVVGENWRAVKSSVYRGWTRLSSVKF